MKMPGLLDSCQDLFGSRDLYEVLDLAKEATENEVKRGYHRMSLKVHPDRVTEDDKEDATKKFQTLGKVYSILSDKDKRAVYDESGEVDDENDLSQERDWYQYWRILFAKISVKDIEEFEEKYKGSQDELEDLKAAYVECEGDLDFILDTVLCASIDDEDRFRGILQGLVDQGELPEFNEFTKEKKSKKAQRRKKAAKEAAEADEMKKEMGIGDEASLQALILGKQQSRQNQAEDFFSQLEAKYAKPKKSKKGK